MVWSIFEVLHGSDGPLTVSDAPNHFASVDRFVAACIEAGYPPNADFNGPKLTGIGEYQFTIHGGRRRGVRAALLG